MWASLDPEMAMKVLFIQVTRDSSSEYSIHRNLAEHTDPSQIDGYFCWQRSERWNETSAEARPGRDFFFDFGRDLSLQPKPSRWQRALLMGKRFPKAVVEVYQLVKQVRPDLLYVCQHDYDLYMAQMLGAMCKIPYVVHVNYPVGLWLSGPVVRLIRNARNVIACSHFVRRTIIEHGADKDRVAVLHNPARVAEFGRPTQAHVLRSEFGIEATAPVILSVGRLDPSKGHLALIEAFAEVHRHAREAYLLICGQTFTRDQYELKLKQRVAELGLREKVIFAGQRMDLPNIMADSDIFCLPTVDEAFGLVFPEAMAAGLPVVAYRSGGVPEIVVDGVTGLLSEPNDIQCLAENLLQLVSNPEQARQFGQMGRTRAYALFTPDKLSVDWVQLLHRFGSG
jgi:glycosyltransferase involved in cell wall biosynthesis